MMRRNLCSEIMAYFDVNVEEFQEFWASLTPDERHEYMIADLTS